MVVPAVLHEYPPILKYNDEADNYCGEYRTFGQQ